MRKYLFGIVLLLCSWSISARPMEGRGWVIRNGRVTIIKPGPYDAPYVLVPGEPGRPDRLVFTEGMPNRFLLEGHHTPHELKLNARDDIGIRLATLPADDRNAIYRNELTIFFGNNSWHVRLQNVSSTLFVSNGPSVRIHATETYADFPAGRVYFVRHDPVEAISGNRTLIGDGLPLLRIPVRIAYPREFVRLTFIEGTTPLDPPMSWTPPAAMTTWEGELFLTRRPADPRYPLVPQLSTQTSYGVFRTLADGRFLVQDQSLFRMRVIHAEGESVTMGGGPYFVTLDLPESVAFIWMGVTGQHGNVLPITAVEGAFRTYRVGTGTPDESVFSYDWNIPIPAEVRQLPTLTSLSLRNGAGQRVDTFRRGSDTRLEFSAAALRGSPLLTRPYRRFAHPMRGDATTVEYRIGAGAWQRFRNVRLTATTNDDLSAPFGLVYSVDLAELANVPAGSAVSLRFYFLDAMGAEMSMKFEPSFRVE